MQLLLMRHGEASYYTRRSQRDKDRPLTMHRERPRRVGNAGAWLKAQGPMRRMLILGSSAIRTRQRLLAECWGSTPAHIKAAAHIDG